MELKPVVVLTSEFIQPASLEVERTKYELTAFDLMMKFAPYQKRMLFYAAPSGFELSEIVSSLKKALSEVLVGFHPLAGRMRTGDGISSPILEVDCTEELNVKFMEASTDTTLAELGDFEPSEFCDSLCDIGSPPPKYPWTPEYPLLFVQATRFKCGGICVAIAFSHQATDGVSAWKFMNSWAQLARTGNLADGPQEFYTFKCPQLKTEEEFLQAGAVGGFHPKDEADPPVTPASKDSTLRMKLYKLDKAFIEKLKSEAGVAKDGRKFTTYEALCAYFWRKMTGARALTSTSNFVVLVNTRGRIKSISASYFGNAITAFLVTASVEELMNNELSYAAGLLHDGIVAFDGEKAEKCAAFLSEAMLHGQRLNGFKSAPFAMVVSSPRHPVYETDFGFGRPIGTTFGTNDLREGKLYLFPSSKDGGVDVTVVLTSEAMDRLLKGRYAAGENG